MLTHLFSLVAMLVVLAFRGGNPPREGVGMSASVTPLPQAVRFPQIPPPSEFDTTTEHSDVRRLMVGTCPARCRFGPLASIQPRSTAAQWGRERRDAGEVIARMISQGGQGAYQKFNLQDRGAGKADTVFWAVMKVGDSLVSIFHSTTPGTKDVVARTDTIGHVEGFFRGVALARWLWSDKDDLAWGTCDGGVCCRSPGR